MKQKEMEFQKCTQLKDNEFGKYSERQLRANVTPYTVKVHHKRKLVARNTTGGDFFHEVNIIVHEAKYWKHLIIQS